MIELEYLSSVAVKYLLPEDEVCHLEIIYLNELNEKALIIERFDRFENKRKHFEEFNQLLNNYSAKKYDLSYDQMAQFMFNSNKCTEMEVIKLFARILAYILIGNTDAHLKNFAMFYDGTQLKLTPQYDVVASAYFIPFKTLALEMNGKKNFDLKSIKPKDIVDFAFNRNGFNLNEHQLVCVVNALKKNKDIAICEIKKQFPDQLFKLKQRLCEMITKRWNGTFNGIEGYLDKRKKGI